MDNSQGWKSSFPPAFFLQVYLEPVSRESELFLQQRLGAPCHGPAGVAHSTNWERDAELPTQQGVPQNKTCTFTFCEV